MASRLTSWLYPNYHIEDDSGQKVPLTGKMPLEYLTLTSFGVGKEKDKGVRKLVSLCTGAIAFILLVASLNQLGGWLQQLGYWGFPILLLCMFAIFHQTRVWAGKSCDEEILQQSIRNCRRRRPNQCPACDSYLAEVQPNGFRSCRSYGAQWANNPLPRKANL